MNNTPCGRTAGGVVHRGCRWLFHGDFFAADDVDACGEAGNLVGICVGNQKHTLEVVNVETLVCVDRNVFNSCG